MVVSPRAAGRRGARDCGAAWRATRPTRLRVRRVLGHSLGALGYGVLGKLAGEDEADGRLDLARRERAFLVVAHELARLNGDALEGVVDERVHDRH
eukprot:CAMPEP_0179845036 /NCGR_PEP_ID=MMETSP0982-20121206/4690_1 /TAXON_ID=483367 /ORGANISM="non described non described, Strain CCMP 2436" /LENGTH=95 /DNA_ID=CAMNT_0021729837 /DNA_START=367 /DNA_END=651 /DNA_ORIENTATION=+